MVSIIQAHAPCLKIGISTAMRAVNRLFQLCAMRLPRVDHDECTLSQSAMRGLTRSQASCLRVAYDVHDTARQSQPDRALSPSRPPLARGLCCDEAAGRGTISNSWGAKSLGVMDTTLFPKNGSSVKRYRTVTGLCAMQGAFAWDIKALCQCYATSIF
jgi:hypothetical protein